MGHRQNCFFAAGELRPSHCIHEIGSRPGTLFTTGISSALGMFGVVVHGHVGHARVLAHSLSTRRRRCKFFST